MKAKILELLNKIYGIDFSEIKLVTYEMYQCTTVQGNFFARITNYKTYDEQLEEVAYTNFLYLENSPLQQILLKNHVRI